MWRSLPVKLFPSSAQGTSGIGEDRRQRKPAIAALRFGLDLGMRLIDTAEISGDAGAIRYWGVCNFDTRDVEEIVELVYNFRFPSCHAELTS